LQASSGLPTLGNEAPPWENDKNLRKYIDSVMQMKISEVTNENSICPSPQLAPINPFVTINEEIYEFGLDKPNNDYQLMVDDEVYVKNDDGDVRKRLNFLKSQIPIEPTLNSPKRPKKSPGKIGTPIEIPKEYQNEKIIEVPDYETETRYTQVEIEVIREVPRYTERIIEIEKVTERIIEVEKIIETIIEIPKTTEIIKYTEVPHEIIRQIIKPVYVTKEIIKTIQVPQIQEIFTEVEEIQFIYKDIIQHIETPKTILETQSNTLTTTLRVPTVDGQDF
jgi:hypothetical protein